MIITADQFRTDFPEFASTTKFPDGWIDFWAKFADNLLPANRWGNLLEMGSELLIAHNVTLQRMDMDSANAGQAPGTGDGLASNQGAGSVSLGIDTQATIEDTGGNYNATMYGVRFLRMARIVGIGGLQL
jgi:hypothetical protein